MPRPAVRRVSSAAAERAAYLGYTAGWALVRRLPEPAAYQLFDVLADVAWWRHGRSVRQLEANLRRVVGWEASDPALRRLAREAMRSYLRYWCDVFRLPDWDRERVVGAVTPVGEHYLREAMAAGTGFVAALPHLGNWDHAGAWGALTGTPVTTVAERLRPERLYDRFVAFREGLGMEILPLTGRAGSLGAPAPGEREVLGVLAARLREGRLVCLLAERDLKATGVEVTFFGEPARMPPGPALLALRTGAPLHPVTCAYEQRGGRHGLALTIHPPVGVPPRGTTRERVAAMTQQVADVFAQAIAEAPADWHMLQPLWPADLRRPETRAASAESSRKQPSHAGAAG